MYIIKSGPKRVGRKGWAENITGPKDWAENKSGPKSDPPFDHDLTSKSKLDSTSRLICDQKTNKTHTTAPTFNLTEWK